MEHIQLIVAALSSAVFISGCGAGSERGFEHDPHRVLQGSIEENVLKVQASEWIEECDLLVKSRQLEVARAIDSRRAEIEQFSGSRGSTDTFKVVPLGPLPVRERVAAFRPRSGWALEADGWADIHAEYLRIRERPVDLAWVNLNTRVRAIVVDDQSRVLDGVNLSLDKDSGRRVIGLAAAIGACVDRESCADLGLPADLLQFVNGNPTYSDYLRWIRESQDRDTLRMRIQGFARRARSDARRYEFRLNPGVTRTSRNELQVALDAGLFGPVKETLGSYIERAWSRDRMKVRVRWTDLDSTPEAFRMIAEAVGGARSYVMYSDQTVHLFPGVRTGAIAHEIGHVLGFKDHYYTIWKPETCSYAYQTRDEDIMSHADGGVTEEEWDELDSSYPARRL